MRLHLRRAAAATLVLLALTAPVAATANAVGVQELESRVRTSLADVGQAPNPQPLDQPDQALFRSSLMQRFDGAVPPPVTTCAPGTAALAVVAAHAPQFVDAALSAWHQMSRWFGGRPVSASIGIGKEVLGVSNGREVADHWIDFHINVGLFRHSPMTGGRNPSQECLRN